MMRKRHWFCGVALLGALGADIEAMATPGSATEAATLVSRAYAIDTKCGVLAEAERDELMDFLARAEIALAEQASVKLARDAIGKGKSLGQAAACDGADSQLVRTTLELARSASVESQMQPVDLNSAQPAQPPDQAAPSLAAPVQAPQSVALATATAPAKPAKPKKTSVPAVKKVKLQTPVQKPTASLTRYAGLAEKYYVELKCRSMSRAGLKRLYARVLSNHHKAVAENGAASVKAMLRTAEARARAAPCS